MAERMYAAGQQQGEAGAQDGGAEQQGDAPKENVVDAEFEEVKGDDKK
jgi:hypothetical protein